MMMTSKTTTTKSEISDHPNTPPRWNKLNIPGFKLLLYRLDLENENPNVYTLFVTNMVHIWVEERVITTSIVSLFVCLFIIFGRELLLIFHYATRTLACFWRGFFLTQSLFKCKYIMTAH